MADWRAFAKQEALRQGVDPSLVLPLIGQESSWNQNAVSRKGAAGFMQLMPGTALELGLSEADRFNPQKAIPAGITYFKQQLDRFKDPAKALAAYNAGPGAVQKFGGVPPYSETQNYVRKNAMATKTDLSADDLIQLAGGSAKGAKTLSVDDLVALAQSAKPKRIPLKVIDKTKPISAAEDLASLPWYQRAAIGAGKAGANFLQGIGVADNLGISTNKAADEALMRDPAAVIGNLAGQAGITYSGGKLLGAYGQRMPGIFGQTAQATGRALTTPLTLREAAAGGLVAGTLLQPGSPLERLQNALGGAAGGGVGYGVGKAIGAATQAVGRKLDQPARRQATQALTQRLTVQLQANGLDFNALPRAAQKSLLDAAMESIEKTGTLPNEALQRMADFQALGIDPLKGWVTRSPEEWWMANSLNTVNPRISQRFQAANQQLVQRAGGAAPEASDYQLGQRFASGVQDVYGTKKAAADVAYKEARGMAGRELELNAPRFINQATRELDEKMIGSELPADTLDWFQKISSGTEPFDMGTAMQRLQAINGRLYNTANKDQAKALGIVKRHLIDEIEGAGFDIPAGQEKLAAAFKQARGAASKYLQLEREPVIQDVIGGKFTPETLPDMMGKLKVDDLQNLARLDAENPGLDALPRLRDAAAEFIRSSAVLQGETGGKFTIAGLRKALDKIGPENGRLLFGDDWNNYQALLRAGGSIMNAPTQPVGSPTFQNFARLLSRIPIPGVPAAVNLAVTGAAKAKQAMDVNRLLQPGLYGAGDVLTNRQLIQRAFQQAPASPMPSLIGAPIVEGLRRSLLDQER